MANKAVHLIARGMVQGVGFRFFVRGQAGSRGLKGWVKNLPDGTVEILAEGGEELLEDFINRVRQGPTFGSVSGLTLEWVEPSGLYTNFNITF